MLLGVDRNCSNILYGNKSWGSRKNKKLIKKIPSRAGGFDKFAEGGLKISHYNELYISIYLNNRRFLLLIEIIFIKIY